jgi:hypothetical protein
MVSFPLFITLIFISVACETVSNSTWVSISPGGKNRWTSRHSHAIIQFPSGQVWLLGGSSAPNLFGYTADGDASKQLHDSYTAGPDLSTWSTLTAASPPWRGVAGFAAAARAQSPPLALVLLAGGLRPTPGNASNATLCNDVWRTTDGVRWITLSGGWGNVTRFAPRHGHALVFDGAAFFALGGFVGATVGGATAAADVWQSDAASASPGENWTSVPQKVGFGSRAFFAAAHFAGAMFVAGGAAARGGPLLGTVMRSTDGAYAPPTRWVLVAALPGGRAGAALLAGPPGIGPNQPNPLGALWLLGGQASPLELPGEGSGAAPALACDTWRSDESGGAWTLVEAAGALGCKAGAASVIARGAGGGSAAGPAVLGGLQAMGARGELNACAEIWASTANLFCEEEGLVCGGRGACPAAAVDALRAHFAAPPFNVTCACNAPYVGARCAGCDPTACVHGLCAPVNPSVPDGPTACVCSDGAAWAGAACATAVCARGCSDEHGSCAGAPGSCVCAPGWTGELCVVAESAAAALARAISQSPRAPFLITVLVGLALAHGLAAWANAPDNWLLGGGGGGSRSKGAAQGSARKAAFSHRRPVFERSYLRARFSTGGGDAAAADLEPLLGGGGGGGSRGSPGTPFTADAHTPGAPPNFASRHGGAVLLSPFRGPGAAPSPALRSGAGVAPSAKLLLSQAASGASPPPKAHVRFAARLAHFDDDADKPSSPFY